MASVYDYWQREIDQPGSQRRDTEEAILGWWRVRGARTKWDYPAVIWKDTAGKTWLKVGRKDPWLKDSDEWFQWTQWQFVKADAVSREDYEVAIEAGHWADGKPIRRPDIDGETKAAPQSLGDLVHDPDNAADPAEEIADEIEALAERIEQIAPITDQKAADRAAELYQRMRTLWKQADEARTKEKEPHLEAGRAVDGKWKPALAQAEEAGTGLKRKINAFLSAEEARKAEEQRQAAEANRKAQEALAAKRGTGYQPPEETAPAPRAHAHSAYGKSVGLVTRRKGVILNEVKFINAIKKRSDFQEFIQKIADGLARANQPTNGLEIKEVRE